MGVHRQMGEERDANQIVSGGKVAEQETEKKAQIAEAEVLQSPRPFRGGRRSRIVTKEAENRSGEMLSSVLSALGLEDEPDEIDSKLFCLPADDASWCDAQILRESVRPR